MAKTKSDAIDSSSKYNPMQRRLREGIMIIMVAVSLFLLLTLFTHDSTDPAWMQAVKGHDIVNVGGRVGAFWSDLLLFAFGYLAYTLPCVLFYTVWMYFRHRNDEDMEHLTHMLILRVAGFLLILLSGCALASLHVVISSMDYAVSGGGIVGAWVALGVVQFFNAFGANLVLFALFLAGITLFTGLAWLRVMDYVGEQIWRVKDKLVAWTTRIDLWVSRSTEEIDLVDEPEVVEASSAPEPQARIEPKVRISRKAEPEWDPDEPFISTPPVIQRRVEPSVATRKERAVQESESIFEPPLAGTLPPLTLLDPSDNSMVRGYSNEQLEHISREVELRLQDFGIQVKVTAVHPGPVVTRFELQLAAGTKVSRITALAKDLARSLAVVSVRVVEVIPGKPVIGLELPNMDREIVRLREILSSELYADAHSPLSLGLGKDIAGNSVVVDLAKMPHLLVAGTTGSGKSVGMNAMLLSLLYKATPEQLRLILIDPKMLELSVYEGIPHLLTPVVTDMKDAANALRWCVAEMDRRYRLMAALGVRNLAGFNAKIQEAKEKGEPLYDPLWQAGSGVEPTVLEGLPYVVVLVDEFADMMMVVGKKVEELIARIAQKARAAGIHLLLATQRPSVDVITGLIKANIPTRIAFQVSSKIDSRTILDQQGAEQLLGHGDMLYLAPGTGVPVRIHGAFVADEEVHRVVHDLKRRGQPQYLESILDGGTESGVIGDSVDGDGAGEQDPLYDQAVQIIVETRRASISNIQRRLKIGYNRAANIVEAMEAAGLVSGMDNNGGRTVLVGES